MRARNIKPGFFLNEVLVTLPFEVRLLFQGLWMICDREGRLEDRPLRIKMTLFPADDVDVDNCLNMLHNGGLIHRYEVDEIEYIQVVNFLKHQNPHQREKKSIIPEPPKSRVKARPSRVKAVSSPAESLNPESLNPESLNPESMQKNRSNARSNGSTDQFDQFWAEYPKKRKKKPALEIWKRKKLGAKLDLILVDIETRQKTDRRWLQGFIPDPTTYLTQERWDDEIENPSQADLRTKPGSGGHMNESDWLTTGRKNGIEPKVGESMQAFIERVKNRMDEAHG